MLRWKKQLCFLGMTAVLLCGMILYGRRQKAETDAETNTVMSKESERETEPEGMETLSNLESQSLKDVTPRQVILKLKPTKEKQAHFFPQSHFY